MLIIRFIQSENDVEPLRAHVLSSHVVSDCLVDLYRNHTSHY